MKTSSRGMPASALLANGISRHGDHCDCRHCVGIRAERRLDAASQRQAIPVIANAPLQPPVKPPIAPPVPRETDAISTAFSSARRTIAELESARDCWSVAQAADYRRAG